MNILFLTKSFGVGGVEVVTLTLAKEFIRRGHQVSIFSFYKQDSGLDSRMTNVTLHIGNGYQNNECNVDIIKQIIEDENIDIIINQWGLPSLPIKVINKARKGTHVKVISIFHNQPDTNGRIKSVELALEDCGNLIKKFFLTVILKLFKYITSKSLAYVYWHSDLFEVLSPTFVNRFTGFIGIGSALKLRVQTNPVTIVSSGFEYDFSKKEKEIVYCGRIDYNQKRVSRLIDVWRVLEKRFPDWRLTIVGDGIMREPLEQKVQELGINRVSFKGFQDPIEYYKRASMLMLVSEYEGFPLVLAEAMSFGVVPAVYFSYSAAADIINDGENGILVDKPSNGLFPTEVFAEKMAVLMNDENKLHQMQLGAIEKSKEYSLDSIYAQWEKVLNELVSK